MTSGGKLEFSRGPDEEDDGPAENQSQRLMRNSFPNFLQTLGDFSYSNETSVISTILDEYSTSFRSSGKDNFATMNDFWIFC